MFSLQGKTALVVGIANEHSIAYGIAKALKDAGAELVLTYLNAKARPYVEPLAEALGAKLFMPLDVTNADQQDALFAAISDTRVRPVGTIAKRCTCAVRLVSCDDFFRRICS